MEKLEQEMNAPEKMAETPSPKKTAGKKKKFRKNQVIITALAIMIARRPDTSTMRTVPCPRRRRQTEPRRMPAPF